MAWRSAAPVQAGYLPGAQETNVATADIELDASTTARFKLATIA